MDQDHKDKVRQSLNNFLDDPKQQALMRALAPYDHTFQVKAWREAHGPYWFLGIEAPQWALSEFERGHWGTQTPWLHLAEYMAKDYLVCKLDLKYEYWDQITVNVTKGIGPVQDYGDYPWSSWPWAQWAGVVDTWKFWLLRRDIKRLRRHRSRAFKIAHGLGD